VIYRLLAFLMAAGSAHPQAIPDSVRFNVTSDVKGLYVYLDGERIGRTPVAGYRIATGPHEIRVASPYGTAWNQPDFSSSFVAVPEIEYQFRAVFERNILINSIPFGAEVYIDDLLMGRTPLQISERGNELRLSKIGFQDYSLPLKRIETLSHLVRLVPDPEWVRMRKDEIQIKQKRISRRRKMMFASMGFAALAGLSTIHFRSKGNSAYSDYLQAAHPDMMNRYYDRAEKFDRIAGVTYALFEFGFVATGYFFLTSRP